MRGLGRAKEALLSPGIQVQGGPFYACAPGACSLQSAHHFHLAPEGRGPLANGVASLPYCGAIAASAAQLALTLSRSELDLRLALEESGREDLLRRLPQALQQMLNEPGLVLARPDWLREFMLWIYIGAPAPHPAPQ